MKSKWVSAASVVGMIVLAGCSCAPETAVTVKPLPTMATAVPAAVSTATPTPFPTGTPVPTGTAEPTRTPAPSDTPDPTLIQTPSVTPTLAVVLTRIGDITAARAGEEVTVEAEVVSAASFSAGFKFTLDDGTGQIMLLMWHNVYDDCWDAPEINLGARVRATGEIGEYEGELQIEPSFGGGVEAVEGAAPWAALRDIGSLSGSDAGQRVMIEGRVVRVEGSEGWAKIFVGDDTGEVLVFIWSNILDRIPDNTKLGVEGTRVRVVGTLEVYDYNLEVVPALPYDVVVLE